MPPAPPGLRKDMGLLGAGTWNLGSTIVGLEEFEKISNSFYYFAQKSMSFLPATLLLPASKQHPLAAE